MNENEKTNDDKEKRRYDKRIRWQETRIKQMSYVNYLILTLSLGGLGFATSLIFEDNFDEVVSCHCLYRFSLALFSLSIIFGIVCATTRLIDFRKTARITKLKHDDKDKHADEIKELCSSTECLGKCSWFILWCQIGLFSAGFVALISAIGLSWL